MQKKNEKINNCQKIKIHSIPNLKTEELIEDVNSKNKKCS